MQVMDAMMADPAYYEAEVWGEKDGTFKIPADKLLDKPLIGGAPVPAATDFMQIPDNIDEELPFK